MARHRRNGRASIPARSSPHRGELLSAERSARWSRVGVSNNARAVARAAFGPCAAIRSTARATSRRPQRQARCWPGGGPSSRQRAWRWCGCAPPDALGRWPAPMRVAGGRWEAAHQRASPAPRQDDDARGSGRAAEARGRARCTPRDATSTTASRPLTLLGLEGHHRLPCSRWHHRPARSPRWPRSSSPTPPCSPSSLPRTWRGSARSTAWPRRRARCCRRSPLAAWPSATRTMRACAGPWRLRRRAAR